MSIPMDMQMAVERIEVITGAGPRWRFTGAGPRRRFNLEEKLRLIEETQHRRRPTGAGDH